MTMQTPEVLEIEPQPAIAVRAAVAPADLPAFFGRAFTAAVTEAAAAGVEIVGPAFGYYPEQSAGTMTVEAGFPVSGAVEGLVDTHLLVLPGGRVVQAVHEGSYDTLHRTYADLEGWMTDHGLRPASGPWELYLTDPGAEPDPRRWRTRIVWPVS